MNALDRLARSLKPLEFWLACLILIAVIALYGSIAVDFDRPPFEDAAMLMRYAEHVARGHGVVWNIGEAPVDGATDFLFMGSVAALIRLGIATGRAVRVLGLAAHVLTVILVYGINRRLWGAPGATALVTALYLAVGTGLWYVAAYFGTPFFALFAATTWAFGLLLMEKDAISAWASWGFALSGLITGLIRPEGVLLAALMLASILIYRGWRRSLPVLTVFAGVMLIAGGAYFAWHWSYFGHALPNPYYKKGAGLLHPDSFWESLTYLLRFAGPFAIAFILGLRSREVRRRSAAYAVTLIGFASLFILVSNETNFGGRFQYALWPIVLMSFYPLVRGLGAESGWRFHATWPDGLRAVWSVAAVILAAGVLVHGARQACQLTAQQRHCGIAYEADGRYEMARQLSQYRDKGYVMATSEAGLLPLYSGWTAVDTWGLNDPWIAQNGEITPAYLATSRPHLIIFHAYFSPLVAAGRSEKDLENAWHRMTLTLQDYAEANNYALAAAFGDSPYEAHYYYVRTDFADAGKIAREIERTRDYRWYATGKKAINYAGLQPQEGR